jgi:hypothetical protein
VITLLFLRPGTPPSVPGPAGELLGDGKISIQKPDDRVPPGQWPAQVVWTGPKGLEYVLRIVEYVDGVEGRELFAPPAIIAHEIALPAPEFTRSWPEKIKLLLESRNKEGTEQDTAEAVWERSR